MASLAGQALLCCPPSWCQARAASQQRHTRSHHVQTVAETPQRRTAVAAASVSSAAAATAAAPLPAGTPLRPIQPRPLPLTAEGFVPCTATLDAVPPALQPLLSAAVEACQAQLGSSLLGVYVRGSLVQPGAFLPGISDADFLVLHLPLHAGTSSSGSGGGGGSVSGREGAAAESCAAGSLREAAERLQRDFPQCVKVELKVVELAPGAVLHPWALQWQRCQQLGQADSEPLPPSALADHAMLAFQLKTQAVCLWGWDLPALLPDVAALPPLQLLPQLVEDVAAALRHAQQQLAAAEEALEGAGEHACSAAAAAAARAVRWALKRCLRAAAELCFAGGSRAAGQPEQEQEQQRQLYWSRDLWWCVHAAAECHPQLTEQLMAGLRQYVDLAAACSIQPLGSSGSNGSSGSSGASDGAAPQLRRLQQQLVAVEQGAKAAAELAAQLDGLFLQQMLTEEPGWLTHHRDSSWPSGSGPASSSGSSGNGGNGGWWQRLRVRTWAATSGDSMEASLLGAPPPPVAAAVAGPVLTLDWQQPEAQQQAAAVIAAMLAAAGGMADGSILNTAASSSELPLPPQPVLLKGAAAHWPAVQRWSLAHLAAGGLEGRARLAPSLHFPFTEPRLAAVLAEQQGAAALPSCLARMSAAEFSARMQRGNPCGLPPLVYGRTAAGFGGAAGAAAGTAGIAGEGQEYLYFQAELPPGLLADCDLASPPFVLPWGSPGGGSMWQSQAARVWVGPQGAISPTHYDLSQSFLTQIRGRKRMLFWSPDELPYLYTYPDTHLLRRRSRVNMHAPQAGRFPLFARAAAREALLEPGDVIFFPSRWAHYTESLDFSISVTCRFAGVGAE